MNPCENHVVKEPTIFSDHSQLICWATISATASAPPIFEPSVETFNLPKQFIWNEDSKDKLINLLKRDDFLLRLSQFETTTFTTDSEGVNLAIEHFTEIINDICIQSLRLARKKKKKTKVHKKWLDSDCVSLRKQLNLLSSKKHRNPFDSNLRHDYHLAKKNFKN